MPQLVIEQPGVQSFTVPLSGTTLSLGRAEDNDVVLVADEVSRHHAKIIVRGNRLALVDLNSMNGTYVNRQRIVERLLSHMDEVWFGSKCRVVFRDDTASGVLGQVRVSESTVRHDLDKIRAEMDRVGNSMTMLGSQAHSATLIEKPVQTPKATADDLVTMSRAYRRLAMLYEAGKRLIASDFDLSKRLADALDTAIAVLEAERGFVMLRDEKTGGLFVKVAREMGHHLEASSPSMGIAGRSAIDGDPVLMNGQDEEFAGRASIITQKIASAMCVPLQVEGRILGSIYLDTRRPDKVFTTEDLELFSSLAAQSAIAIENAQLYVRMVEAEKKRANLGRFLSPTVVDAVMAHENDVELGGQKRLVSTLFADIRDSTTMAERLPASELVDLLNEHFTAMTDEVFKHEGTLDKYNGDEVMALFGAPIDSPDDARRAVFAALAMQEKNEELNILRAGRGQSHIDIGIGVDTGEVIAGYIGSPKRLDYTVIGDHVNTAKRLCSMAKAGQVVVGEATYQAVKEIVRARAIGTVMLKGKETPVQAYEIVGLNEAPPTTPE